MRALQRVPEHAELLVRWVSQLRTGAWLAMQLPGNFDTPSHRLVRDLTSREPWVEPLWGMPLGVGKVVDTAVGYAELLTDARCRVDAWETTYVHELTGEHPVLE